jgi:hypothetical protein
MNRQLRGILSLLYFFTAVLTAILRILPSSLVWTGGCLVGILFPSLVVIWSFCTKCPRRDTGCGHVIPGMFTRVFPAGFFLPS